MSEIEYQTEAPLSFTSAETRAAAAAVAEAFLEGTEEVAEQPVAAVQVPAPSQPTQQYTEPADVAEPVEETPFDFASFEPQLTPEMEDLLADEIPDFDTEARHEIQAELQSVEDAGEYVDYDTDSAARVRALEKKNAFLEKRLVETNRGKWVAEQLKTYPLLAQFAPDKIKNIDATSRRAFAREAARVNADAMQFAKPLLDHLRTRIAADSESAHAQARGDVQASWGVPMVEPASAGSAAERAQRVQAARKTEDLGKVIKTMIESEGGNKVL